MIELLAAPLPRGCLDSIPTVNHLSEPCLSPGPSSRSFWSVQSLCDLALRFGEDDNDEGGMSRPFGVALLVAGWDAEGGPVL